MNDESFNTCEGHRQDRINELNDIIQKNRTRTKEYQNKYEEITSQIDKLDSDLRKLKKERTILSFVIPAYQRAFNAQVEALLRLKEIKRQEKDDILDKWNACANQSRAAAHQIEMLNRYAITHNLPGGESRTYYTDDYTIEDGMITFEYKGRLYKIFGSVTISQNYQDVPHQSIES